MIGTLSMLALVALGFNHVDLFVILPFAIINALVGLPHAAGQTADTGATPAPDQSISFGQTGPTCRLAGFNRVLPMQMVYAAIGYGLGFGAERAVDWML